MTAPWAEQMLAFDTETTGVDTEQDRIVTAAAIWVGSKGVTESHQWLIDPGVEIPEAASKIHGITTEKARAEGRRPFEALREISVELETAWSQEIPVVAMNACYDLSIMQAELRRHGLPPLRIGAVLDPLVLDRTIDPFRSGKRNLEALAAHWGVKADDAHTAGGDALAAARIVWAIARQATIGKKAIKVGTLSLADLQTIQREGHAAWAENYELYLRRKDLTARIDRAWPVRAVAR